MSTQDQMYENIKKRNGAHFAKVISNSMKEVFNIPEIDNMLYHAGQDPDVLKPFLKDLTSRSLKDNFNLSACDFIEKLPEEFIVIGNQIFNYHSIHSIKDITPSNECYIEYITYYGDQAWVQKQLLSSNKEGGNTIKADENMHLVNTEAGDGLFNRFLFDNKTKFLKQIDLSLSDALKEFPFFYLDSFANDFNCYYGGNPKLNVQNGNLVLDKKILIETHNSAITHIRLPKLTEVGPFCLIYAFKLQSFEASVDPKNLPDHLKPLYRKNKNPWFSLFNR